jgi:hypothetical protein
VHLATIPCIKLRQIPTIPDRRCHTSCARKCRLAFEV